MREAAEPSVVIFRRSSGRRPEEQAELLLRQLPRIEGPSEQGSVVILEEERLRIRALPFGRGPVVGAAEGLAKPRPGKGTTVRQRAGDRPTEATHAADAGNPYRPRGPLSGGIWADAVPDNRRYLSSMPDSLACGRGTSGGGEGSGV